MKSDFESLQKNILSCRKLAIALSGGLDSSVLAAFSAKVLGAKNCLAITAVTPYMALSETSDARDLCKKIGVELVEISYEKVFDEIILNPPDRCFLCKTKLFSQIKSIASSRGFETVADGTNADDIGDYRPGMAALKNLKIASPFLEAGLGKDAIRALAMELKLGIESKSAYACLLTRFEHGAEISNSQIRKVEAAENILRSAGFDGVRVRVHSDSARVELKKSDLQTLDFPRIALLSEKIKELGFKFVSLDLSGYVRGNMNRL